MTQEQPTDVRVRRAPKFGAFMVVGAGIALILTLIVTSLFPVDPSVGFGALFGYFCIYTIPAGVAIGAIIALVLDRRSLKRARTVAAEHEAVEAVAETPEAAEAPETSAE